ncbi:AP-4 complex subunit epsilon-1 [Megalops cyprinoides]|uniref:AP-4 complex subunit epsilon-1 n=1 Tax=Megalops cyprinoides TaxID=118141 RepID=UPI001864AB43|nr:AP-4 complex subunit epsilon-1 [Megalops cyprinoides]
MSDVVEKTLTALPSLLSLDTQSGAGKLSATSKLGNLIRSLTELTSKHEEEKLIKKELAAIKEQVSSPNTPLRQMKEIMVRAVYCEMLGYEASFSYIHAIKLAQQGSVLEKRVGYLAVSLFLNESHDLLLLLVNTVLKDLQSTNLIEVCMALTVVSQIFPKDMIPAVLPLVEDKLTHSKEIIRRKAVLALYKFYLIAPNQVQHIHDKFRKALCDKDPGVMTASLHIYLQMIKENPDGFKELTGSFVTILRQVVGGKLPVDFNYHSVPAPWLQIQLLRMLAFLGKEDQSTSEMMYEVLDESLRRAEINHNITYAILYECVKTIYTIHPKSELLEKAAKCVGKFVLSPKINLKYLGLKALTYVVQQDPNLALQHQMTIIECLDHPDSIIKRETLELLYRITNGQNVAVIVERMLDFLRLGKGEHTTIDLVGKVAELAEKYAPDNGWFIQTMNTVFFLGGDMMQPEIPNNFLRLLAEGFDNADENRQLRLYAVDSYLSLLQTDASSLPQRFLQVISWVLGEFSFLKTGLEPTVVLVHFGRLLEQDRITTETKIWILSAMCKLCRGEACMEEAAQRYSSSLSTTLRQQALELHTLSQNEGLRASVLPRDASWDELEMDSSLSFLDGFVSDALAQGAAPYKPPHQRQEELSQEKVLNFEPYGLLLPVSLSAGSLTDRQSPTGLSLSSGLSGNSADLPHKGGSNTLKLEGVRRVWGKEGYLLEKEAEVETAVVVPSPLESSRQQDDAERAPLDAPALGPTAEYEQVKQQLASSLFVGLGPQNEPCLMGKSDAPLQRFRRKNKAQELPVDTRKKLTDTYSSHNTVDSLLDKDLLDSLSSPQGEGQTRPQDTPLHSDLKDTLKSQAVDRLSRVEGESELLGGDMELEPFSEQSHRQAEPLGLGLMSRLPLELCELGHSQILNLSSDHTLSLSVCKVYREDALVLVIFICNTSSSPVDEISVQLSSEELKVLDGLDGALPALESHGMETFRCSMVMETPLVQSSVSGTVTYHACAGLAHELQFSLGLTLVDFIRPLLLSTEDYGKLWLAFNHDVKQNLQLLADQEDSLSATLNTLTEKLQLHLVDIIGMEGIVACQLLPGRPCLLHCHAHTGSLAVWLRSPVPDLPDCLLYHCQKALRER